MSCHEIGRGVDSLIATDDMKKLLEAYSKNEA